MEDTHAKPQRAPRHKAMPPPPDFVICKVLCRTAQAAQAKRSRSQACSARLPNMSSFLRQGWSPRRNVSGAEPNNLQPGSRRCKRWFSGALRMASREWISLDASKALLDRVLGNERVKRHACFRRRLRLGDWDCEGFPLPDEGASPRRSLCTVKVLFRLRLCVEWSQSFRACSKTWQESLPGYCHWRANEQWPGKWRCQRHLSA
mmetsp:Transcript_63551/g.139260  ORF Transcript_63551/g.139260 Transcript_63551/m.139260 type:complete len:204 (+) Transcript_63551:109-720(+)